MGPEVYTRSGDPARHPVRVEIMSGNHVRSSKPSGSAGRLETITGSSHRASTFPSFEVVARSSVRYSALRGSKLNTGDLFT